MRSLVEETRAELDQQRRALAWSERAANEGRIVNETVWLENLELRRQRIRELEEQLEREEAEAA